VAYVSRFRHLASALWVVFGGVLSTAFLGLDLAGLVQIAIPGVGSISTGAIALVVIFGTAVFAAGNSRRRRRASTN